MKDGSKDRSILSLDFTGANDSSYDQVYFFGKNSHFLVQLNFKRYSFLKL